MICIRAFPRIHIGLVDLGNATPRRYGGAGFMLNCLPTEIHVSEGQPEFVGLEILDQRGRRDLVNALQRLCSARQIKLSRIEIRSIAPQHIGLGTKTTLTLAALKAHALFSKLNISATEIQLLSGRGGASGVGIHGFLRGGFIVDAGHAIQPEEGFAPSSAQQSVGIPTFVASIKIPKPWRFVLIRPNGFRYSGRRERRFFRDNTPLPRSEVRKTLALLYHGIVPSILDDRIDDLKAALWAMHHVGFKRRELLGQTPAVRSLFAKLAAVRGCAVGMSSMGPTLFAVTCAAAVDVLDEVREIARIERATLLAVCAGRNHGHEIL